MDFFSCNYNHCSYSNKPNLTFLSVAGWNVILVDLTNTKNGCNRIGVLLGRRRPIVRHVVLLSTYYPWQSRLFVSLSVTW